MLVAKWLLLHLLHSIFSEFDFAPDPVGEFTPLHRPLSRLGIPSPHFPTPSMRSASRCLVLTACPVFFCKHEVATLLRGLQLIPYKYYKQL